MGAFDWYPKMLNEEAEKRRQLRRKGNLRYRIPLIISIISIVIALVSVLIQIMQDC